MYKAKPFLITFEGIEGCGKSYQSRKLYLNLKKKRIPAILTREPGGTPSAEKIRDVILDDYFHPNLKEKFNKYTDTLLYLAARNEHVINKLKPELNVEGNFLDIYGNIIGQHIGIANYTVGQRKGLGISGSKNPLYVLKIDKNKNAIYLGKQENLKTTRVFLRDINWLDDTIENLKLKCSAKIRSTQKETSGILSINEKRAIFTFDEVINTTAPGQACVFYLNDQVLGGGWIKETFNHI